MKRIDTSIPSEVMDMLPKSKRTEEQVKVERLKLRLADYFALAIRYDDSCNNGHNTFSITSDIKKDGCSYGGCCHDEVAMSFPQYAHLIKWHLCSSDGPLHYIPNTLYHAGDRDCWGGREGEARGYGVRRECSKAVFEALPACSRLREDPDGLYHILVPGHQDAGRAQLVADSIPGSETWVTWTYEGKDRDFDAARKAAIWPEATNDQLILPPEELKGLLLSRLPALMREFKRDIESLGFTY